MKTPKKEASLWENEQQRNRRRRRVLGCSAMGMSMREWNGMAGASSSSVGKSNDCNLEIDLHIYGASR